MVKFRLVALIKRKICGTFGGFVQKYIIPFSALPNEYTAQGVKFQMDLLIFHVDIFVQVTSHKRFIFYSTDSNYK